MAAEEGAARGPYRHVACCVDESPAAARALDEAARVRSLGEGRLTILHALPSTGRFTGGRTPWSPRASRIEEDLREDAREWLQRLGARQPGAEVVLLTAEGEPADTVADWAVRERCDLLVAAPWRGPVARMAHLGSFATRLLRQAPCPVLLVVPD